MAEGAEVIAVSFRKLLKETTVSRAEQMIAKWDSDASRSSYAAVASIFLESRDEARRFLSAVHDLQQAVARFSASDHDGSLPRALSLLRVAMTRLQKEFAELLQYNRDACAVVSPAASSTDASSTFRSYRAGYDSEGEDPLAAAALDYLRDIADCLLASGYESECVEIYARVRRAVVDAAILHLGHEHLAASQAQKLNWESLDFRISQWVTATRPLLTVVFKAEAALSDYVFASSEPARDSCFADVTRDAAVEFFRFPSAVASRSKRPLEKVLHYLAMYRAIRDLSPDLEATFSAKSTAAVRAQADASLLKLAATIRSMIAESESAVYKDASKPVPNCGGVHAAAISVMNHLVPLAEHADLLAELLADESLPSSTTDVSDEEASVGGGSSGSVAGRFGRLITSVLCKLDVKAEQYREASQSYLFLINNVQYVASRAKESKLAEVLGMEWVAAHENKARTFGRGFLRVAWRKVVEAIPERPQEVPDAEARRERMVQFNRLFESVCRSHTGWVVLDGKIRNEIRMAIARTLVARYRPFYERCRAERRMEEGAPVVVRFAPEDLVNHLSGLYCPTTGCSEWDWSSPGSLGSATTSGGSGTKNGLWRWLRESI